MIEKKQTKDNALYFVVKAKNGQVIVRSADYYTEIARDNGIASLKDIMMGVLNSE